MGSSCLSSEELRQKKLKSGLIHRVGLAPIQPTDKFLDDRENIYVSRKPMATHLTEGLVALRICNQLHTLLFTFAVKSREGVTARKCMEAQ